MRRFGLLCAGVVGVTTLTFSSGCDANAKDMQIQALQRENQDLERRNGELESQLAAAMKDSDDARRRALQLQQMIDQLRGELASAQAARPADTSTWKGWTEVGPYAWIDLTSDVLFDSGKADLKGEGRGVLREISSNIQEKYSDRDIWVIGHTDSDPIKASRALWKDNLDLSQGRSHTVALELSKLGIEMSRIIAGGQGEFRPKDSNNTKEGKKRNRRVEVIAVKRPPSDGSAPNVGGPGGATETEGATIVPPG